MRDVTTCVGFQLSVISSKDGLLEMALRGPFELETDNWKLITGTDAFSPFHQLLPEPHQPPNFGGGGASIDLGVRDETAQYGMHVGLAAIELGEKDSFDGRNDVVLGSVQQEHWCGGRRGAFGR